MTVHVAVKNVSQSEAIKAAIRALLARHGIAHATLETEPEGFVCGEQHDMQQQR